MTESEFHAQRRMFAIVHHEVKIAAAGDRRSHREWFMAEGWISAQPGCTGMQDHVRGYYLDGQLVMYKRTDGDDFSHFGVAHLLTVEHLRELKEKLAIPDDAEVWVGAKPDQAGKVWRGHARLGRDFAHAVQTLERFKKE